MESEEAKAAIYGGYLSKFGIEHCESKLKEEMGELIQALEKLSQKTTQEHWKHVQEEIAHVHVFLKVVEIHYGVEEVLAMKYERLHRLHNKLKLKNPNDDRT